MAGQIVDRVVTNVNGHVVLQSDWEQEVAFEALSDGRDPDSFTRRERKAALDRLIDQELLREQVRPSQPAPAEQVAARVAEVRKLHPDCATEEGWHAALQRYGLTQKALEKRLSDQIQLMKLVEDRLRPSIQIDQQAVEAYYHDQLLPEMKKAGEQRQTADRSLWPNQGFAGREKNERTADRVAGESALRGPILLPNPVPENRTVERIDVRRTDFRTSPEQTDRAGSPERRRILWKLFLSFCLFLLIAFALLAWYVTTDSFQQMARRRVIASVEKTDRRPRRTWRTAHHSVPPARGRPQPDHPRP